MIGLPDGRAKGHRLQGDRDGQYQDRDPPVGQRLGVLPLVQTLIEGEEATDEEEDDGDDESIDISTPPIPEVVLGISALARSAIAYQQQDLVAGVGKGVDGLRKHG